MSRRFIVRPLAEADLEHAARWYDAEHVGLASRFLSDVDQVFGRIRERPEQFPVVYGDIRRALLHTFPYAAYFPRQTKRFEFLRYCICDEDLDCGGFAHDDRRSADPLCASASVHQGSARFARRLRGLDPPRALASFRHLPERRHTPALPAV